MAEDKHEQPHTPAPAKGAKIPAAAHATPYVAGEGDPSAEANARALAENKNLTPTPFTAEQIATPRADAADVRQMYIIVGPYRGSVLTMPNDEAENAKDNHWAVEMSEVSPPYDANEPRDHDHELTEEDRANAVKEANEWAAKVNQPPEPPPEGGATKQNPAPAPAPAPKPAATKTVEPAPSVAGYETR